MLGGHGSVQVAWFNAGELCKIINNLKSGQVIFYVIWQQKRLVDDLLKLQDLANSNAFISNSLLFRTRNHFPWICPSVIYYRIF